MTLDEKKSQAQAWFRDLRDQLCAEFERIEEEHATSSSPHRAEDRSGAPLASSVQHKYPAEQAAPPPPALPLRGREFTLTPWTRPEGGGGEIGLMKGRVFEKVGVNISTVHGEFSEQFRKEIPGAASDPRFWATGISLVAHMASPHVPAAHFNTRMIVVGDGTRLWFGGGGDLNPMFPNAQDTADFHGAFKEVCDQTDNVIQANTRTAPNDSPLTTHDSLYEAFRKWCDEYFFIPHRGEARGVGGIFYDYLGLNRLGADTSPIAAGKLGGGGLGKEATQAGVTAAANAALDWQQAFAFTQNVGRAFADIYPALIRRHMHEPWTDAERHHQLVRRGRYAEYNLLYDRGTRFGLMTGGNPEAILMSLPPMAVWE